MIYIATALFCEAKAFIEALGLKEDFGFGGVRVFKNDNFILAVTGAGVLTSASALSFVLGRQTPKKGDVFLNAGVCGGENKGIFVCNKITCPSLSREYYPDMVYDLGFSQRELVTVAKPLTDIPKGKIADMEGAGIFEAIRGHFSLERCFFVKIVSDFGDFEGVSSDSVYALVKRYVGEITEKLLKLPPVDTGFEPDEEILSEIKKLRLSVSQRVILNELLGFYSLKGGDCLGLLKSMPEVKTKAEGREALEKIRSIVI